MLKFKVAEIPGTGTVERRFSSGVPGANSVRGRGSRALSFWSVGLLAVLLIALYCQIAFKLVVDWYSIPDQSHGLIIPLFIAFLLWKDRHVLHAIPQRSSWAGIPLVVFGLLVLLVGVLGADLFLSRISFLLLIIGLAWCVWGLALVAQLRFALFVALLAIPWPAIVMNQITFLLQLQASQLATGLLSLWGIPVLREGNVLQLATIQLEVAEACSGIRSLLSLLTVAVIYGYFAEVRFWRRLVLILASIPIAIAANAARIFGTGLCVTYWDPEKALGFFHEFSGWLIFLVSMLCLYLLHKLMKLIQKRKVRAAI